MKNSTKNSLLFIGSTLICLVFLSFLTEMVLGLFYEQWRSHFRENGNWYEGVTKISENPELMWDYRPYKNGIAGEKNVFTNEHGFRDRKNIQKKKSDDIYRISFIGDSTTFGFGVDLEDSFVKVFESTINEKSNQIKIQALNHGIDGYNINQIAELLRSRILDFNPDKIIYTLCLNDFDFEESSGNKILFFKKPDNFLLFGLQKLYRKVFNIDFHRWYFNKNQEIFFNQVQKMKAISDRKNIDLEIVILPAFYQDKADFDDYPIEDIHQKLKHFFEEEQIPYKDLLSDFRKSKESPKNLAKDIWHPNERGHEFIAKSLLSFINI